MSSLICNQWSQKKINLQKKIMQKERLQRSFWQMFASWNDVQCTVSNTVQMQRSQLNWNKISGNQLKGELISREMLSRMLRNSSYQNKGVTEAHFWSEQSSGHQADWHPSVCAYPECPKDTLWFNSSFCKLPSVGMDSPLEQGVN